MEIELQDGTILDAPDGLSPEQIKSLVVNYTRSQWGIGEKINNVVNQIGSGAYKGLAGVASLPRTLSDLLGVDPDTTPQHPVAGRAVPGAAEYVKQKVGPSQNPGQSLPGYSDFVGFMRAAGIPVLEPDTRADKFLQAGGIGATGVALPGGALPNFMGGVVASEASEVGGQLAEGTKYEGLARLLPAIFGGAAGSKLANMSAASNVEQLLANATRTATPAQWEAARRLQAEALVRGSPITSAEAMAQVQGGNTSLMSIQRNVENMQETAPTMSQFMAQRPAGNQAAVGQTLDQIAARELAPTEVGPRIQQGARGYIDEVRQDINLETEPLYHLSQFDRIPAGEFARIQQNPAFQVALDRVRADPLLGPRIANLPEDSIAVVNAVKKEMDEMQTGFSAYGTEGYSPTRAAAVESGRSPLVNAATGASPTYDAALGIQATRRQAELLPAERAPIGQLAQTDDLAEQSKILLPGSAMKASPEQIGGTVRELVNQGRTADVAALIRTKLQDVFAGSASNVKGTGEQYRGAQFANNTQKNFNSSAELEAAVRALPDGDTQWAGFRRLLDVLEAQGQRLPANSPTSFNTALQGEMARNAGKSIKSFGIEMWGRWNTQRRAEELARILTAPEGVALLRQLAVTGPSTARAQQLIQSFYQGGQSLEKAP
jgi:hypothetical protein